MKIVQTIRVQEKKSEEMPGRSGHCDKPRAAGRSWRSGSRAQSCKQMSKWYFVI